MIASVRKVALASATLSLFLGTLSISTFNAHAEGIRRKPVMMPTVKEGKKQPPPAPVKCPDCPPPTSSEFDANAATKELEKVKNPFADAKRLLDPKWYYTFELDVPEETLLNPRVGTIDVSKPETRDSQVLTQYLWDSKELRSDNPLLSPIRPITGEIVLRRGAFSDDTRTRLLGPGTVKLSSPFQTLFGYILQNSDETIDLNTAVQLNGIAGDTEHTYFGQLVGKIEGFEVRDGSESTFNGVLRILMDYTGTPKLLTPEQKSRGYVEMILKDVPMKLQFHDREAPRVFPPQIERQPIEPTVSLPVKPRAESKPTEKPEGEPKVTKKVAKPVVKPALENCTGGTCQKTQAQTFQPMASLRRVEGGGCSTDSSHGALLASLVLALVLRRRRFVAESARF